MHRNHAVGLALAATCAAQGTNNTHGCRTFPSAEVTNFRIASSCEKIDTQPHPKGHSRILCADLCLDTAECEWIFSKDGTFADDCVLLKGSSGQCSPSAYNGNAELVSRACMSHSPQVTQPGDEIFSAGHFGLALGVILLVMGLPAVLWCRKVIHKIRMEKSAAANNDVETGVGLPQRPVAADGYKAQFRSAGRAVIRAQMNTAIGDEEDDSCDEEKMRAEWEKEEREAQVGCVAPLPAAHTHAHTHTHGSRY